MLKFLDDIPNYKADEEATAPTNERLSQFYAFLEKPDYTKFFVWIEFENPELRWSFERAPYYYEAGKSHNENGYDSNQAFLRIKLRGSTVDD